MWQIQSPIDGGVVVVTGASSGIGAQMARQLAARAAVLVLVARRKPRLDALAEELGPARSAVDVRPCDLTDSAAVEALVAGVIEDHGRVDVLINNAGMGDIGLFEESHPDKNLRMLQVNVVALTALTRAVLPGMVGRRKGGVLNVSSGFGLLTSPGFTAYAASKHYVSGFTEGLRTELGGTGVRVVQVCPGPVATEFEAVAGNPTGQKVPGFIELTAAACASSAIAALDRDRALTVPGVAAWLLIHASWWSPLVVRRAFLTLVGRFVRPKLTRQQSA